MFRTSCPVPIQRFPIQRFSIHFHSHYRAFSDLRLKYETVAAKCEDINWFESFIFISCCSCRLGFARVHYIPEEFRRLLISPVCVFDAFMGSTAMRLPSDRAIWHLKNRDKEERVYVQWRDSTTRTCRLVTNINS